MMKTFVLASLTKLAISSSARSGFEVTRNEEGRLVQQMKIEAPTMTEEDQWGYVMPDTYRCDSCKAVVFHLNKALKKRQMKTRRMYEWESAEVFEETCGGVWGVGAFGGYGIKLINGVNALSGPGLKQPDTTEPGGAFIQMGGQGWSLRLSEICRKIVYDKIGEEELYEKFYTTRKIPESMCYKEMAQCGATVKSQKSKTTKKSKDVSKVEVKSASFVPSPNKTDQRFVKPIGADSFLESLALEDGLDVHSYSSRRDKLLVGMAGKIYSQ